jgi:hypothetical protein
MRMPPLGVRALQDKFSEARQHSTDSKHSLIAAQPNIILFLDYDSNTTVSVTALTDSTNIIPLQIQFLQPIYFSIGWLHLYS